MYKVGRIHRMSMGDAPEGRLQLRAEQKAWGNFVAAVSKVLDAVALPA